MIFSKDLDSSTFGASTFQSITFDQTFNQGSFSYEYIWLSNSSYRIVLEPSGYLFINNCTVYVSIP